MKYLLDTNVVSAVMNFPSGKIVKRIEEVGEANVCTSIIVVSEVKYGIRKRQSRRLTAQFEALLDSLSILPFDGPADDHYAMIRVETEKVGKSVAQNDMLIAAHALALDAVLVTDDHIFTVVPGLKVENWLRD
jgi:tRNA(fMet)-specific endonuclease VapC